VRVKRQAITSGTVRQRMLSRLLGNDSPALAAHGQRTAQRWYRVPSSAQSRGSGVPVSCKTLRTTRSRVRLRGSAKSPERLRRRRRQPVAGCGRNNGTVCAMPGGAEGGRQMLRLSLSSRELTAQCR